MLGQMFAKMMDGSGLLFLPQVAMMLFLVVFVGAVVRTWRTPAKELEHLERLPLEPDLVRPGPGPHLVRPGPGPIDGGTP
jgi:hypothetical protein